MTMATNLKHNRAGKKIVSFILATCLVLAMMPSLALADDGNQATFKNWETIYSELGVDTAEGYDAVTSATNYASSHAGEGSGAAGIPACVNRVKDGEGKTTALDGANIPGGERQDVQLYKASHKTFEAATPNKKYGTDEFLIEPWNGTDKPGTDPEKWSWNNYFDSVYAVTVSDGTTTVGAVPWIDYYGQKGRNTGTSGVGHYNYVEVALNNGPIPTQPSMSVNRYAAFYNDKNELKSGKYTVTVYSTVYKPLVASDIWVPARNGAEISLTDATATSVNLTFVKSLPEDFNPIYKVDGNAATYNDGVLTFDAVKPGNHNVTVECGNVDEGNKKYLDVTGSFLYSIDRAVVKYEDGKLVGTDSDITLADYVGTISKVNVNGTDYIPSGKGGNVAKVINADGSIDLSKTVAADSEEAVAITVTATGYPDFSFEIPAKQQPQPQPVKTFLAKAKITVKNGTYTGKAITPAPVVTVEGKTLVRNTDYTVSYKNNVKAGTASLTVVGKGDYEGSKTASFKINKAAQKMTVKAVKKTVKFANVKKKNQVVAKAITVKKSVGKVTYKKAGGDKKLSINAKTGKITVKKKTKKGNHKIKVKVTAAGNANYKVFSKTITVTIKVK